MTQGFCIEALSSAHDRAGFLSGVEPLDRYLRDLATQDIKRRVSNCFVALDDDDVIADYFTFTATSLPLTEISPEEMKRLPRYASAPAARRYERLPARPPPAGLALILELNESAQVRRRLWGRARIAGALARPPP